MNREPVWVPPQTCITVSISSKMHGVEREKNIEWNKKFKFKNNQYGKYESVVVTEKYGYW
jgi:hypothetical protein